jgi:DNA-binding LytR/AlgR family response regulator
MQNACNVLIIEDEKPAAAHLQRLISQADPCIEITATLTSVDESLHWFKNHPCPDLLFLDVQLSDGLSFEIFSHVPVTCPVIFTTAYEEYAIRSFKVNSIDYLLKPVGMEDLRHALGKFASLQNSLKLRSDPDMPYRIDEVMKLLTRRYKSRFVVNAGYHIRSLETNQVNLFYSLGKATFLLDASGRSYDIDYSLEQVENLVDPEVFFRISRKHIVNIKAITEIVSWSNARLKLHVAGTTDNDILVSRRRMAEFRKWLDQ